MVADVLRLADTLRVVETEQVKFALSSCCVKLYCISERKVAELLGCCTHALIIPGMRCLFSVHRNMIFSVRK